MTFLPLSDFYNSHFQIIFTTFPGNMNFNCALSKSNEKRN